MRCCASACWQCSLMLSGRGCSKTKWLCARPIRCAPPSARRRASRGPFSGGHPVKADGSSGFASIQAHEPEHLKASGCWGSLKAPGNTTSWRYLQRISTASRSASLASPAQHSMCSSMANTPESKRCIRILLLPARDCPALPLRHRRDGVLDAIAAPRRRPLLLRRQGRLRVVAGALRRAGQHNFRI